MSILYKYLRICICIHKIDEKIVIFRFLQIFICMYMCVYISSRNIISLQTISFLCFQYLLNHLVEVLF